MENLQFLLIKQKVAYLICSDLLRDITLSKEIHRYAYFSYHSNEV